MHIPSPRTIDPEALSRWLPKRPRGSHKGDFGQAGILGGAPGMAGAALLAGRAALWLGAGRVYVGLLDDRIGVDMQVPELMLTSPERVLSLTPPGCLVAGPGLGHRGDGWLRQALRTGLPLLLDADALNLIAELPELADAVRLRTAPTLITPHPGEAARLLGATGADIQTDRYAALTALTERFGCGVVLKGAGSLIGFPGQPVWINETGNPGLAAPGMGDVLAGMIAALVAQGLDFERAAVLGVHLHGVAADRAVREGTGPVGLTASEVARMARAGLNTMVYRSP